MVLLDKMVRTVMLTLLATACALFTYYLFFGVTVGGATFKGIIPSTVDGMTMTTSEYYRVFCYDVNHAEHKMFDTEVGSWKK